jgi:hypothetical protein
MIYNLKNTFKNLYYKFILGFLFKNFLKIFFFFFFFFLMIYFISFFTNFFYKNDFFFFNIIFYNYKLISLFDFLLYSFIFFLNEFNLNINIINFQYFFDNYDFFIYIHIQNTWYLIFNYFKEIIYIAINNLDAQDLRSLKHYISWNLLVPIIMFVVVGICHPIANWYVYNVILPISNFLETHSFIEDSQNFYIDLLNIIYIKFFDIFLSNIEYIFYNIKFIFYTNFQIFLSFLLILPLITNNFFIFF